MVQAPVCNWVGPKRERVLCYFEPDHQEEPLLVLMGSHCQEALIRWAEHSFEGVFNLITVELDRIVFYLAASGFEVLREEEEEFTRSDESDAAYLGRRDRGNRGTLIQRVWKDSSTSGHWHKGKHEWFDPVLGCPTVRRGTPRFADGETETKLHESLHIPAGVSHQLVTGDKPALTIIHVMGPDALGMDDYHYE